MKYDLQKILTNYHFDTIFTSLDYPFSIVEIEKGKSISKYVTTHSMIFLLNGTYRIYSIHEDGNEVQIIKGQSTFSVLGDLEFVGYTSKERIVEAENTCTCLLLDYSTCKQELQQDPRFLLYLLNSVSHKIDAEQKDNLGALSLKEKILVYFNKFKEMKEIEKTASQLHCSRRQLQRYLTQLQNEDKIIKVKKGIYKLK